MVDIDIKAAGKSSDSNVDFIANNGVGLNELVMSMSKNIIQKAIVMNTLQDVLGQINKMLEGLSSKLESSQIAKGEAAKLEGIGESILSGIAVLGTATFIDYKLPDEEGSTWLKMIHQGLMQSGAKIQAYSNMAVQGYTAYYAVKEADASSQSEKIQSIISLLKSLIDTFNHSTDGSSNTIDSDMKAIKTMLENYYVSEKPRNYL